MSKFAAIYSILMPGVGQMFNRQYLKGLMFLTIEHFDNIMGHINLAIFKDWNGLHDEAASLLNYQYALFYPGFYVFVVWDALTGGHNAKQPLASSIFLVSGFFGEISTIFLPHLPIPTFTVGMLMLLPMLIGIWLYDANA